MGDRRKVVNAEHKVEKKRIEEVRDSEPDRITRAHLRGKSDCLDYFRRLIVDGTESDYCECVTCDAIYYFNPKDGASSLKKHLMKYCVSLEYREV